MDTEALAFIRILPAGAADIGPDVTRAELREAGLGSWSLACGGRDDLSRELAALDDAGPPPTLPPEYDELIPISDRPPEIHENVVVLRFGTGG